ncbi:T9SS type A sorting domain-containing protein [Flavivirga algicola]|uniref:T9SS type A sorting domain-containing protein n=1 Tax=Flavivirga algicola TaxID=2729136 RepID=A0ABX1RSU5_9FLAO|nr:T9SS type A sorting domain-containing protein [Flavivirga algicola]NMH86241.1 T9SS type A sorting domain-containing protein [Flavivirga algicola]
MKNSLPVYRVIFSLITFFSLNINAQNTPIKKSMILFTQKSSATPFNYDKYKADGIFWGHMLHNGIDSDVEMNNWAADVSNRVSNGEYFFGRLEFDWGWKWMIDFMNDPGAYWAQDLNGNNILWTGTIHNGHAHSWQSHHGPEFLEWLKYQVDRIDLAPITHLMIDSQTSASRTLHWLGGDFSVHSMNNFREYLKGKYTITELSALDINDIDNFNYRNFLISKGYTLNSYKQQALSIAGNIPLYDDFVYFQRQALNDVMEELFEYIDTKMPGIAIGATTNLVEPRGFIFSERQTYLAGEFFHDHDVNQSPPFKTMLHFKAAEALDKTLIYFPYPDAFAALYDRSAPKQARGWIAQAYAMGSIFTIPENIWLGGGYPVWSPGWQVYSDLYEFIDDNSELLDDYKAVSNVALAYSVYASLLEGGMDGSATARQTLQNLVEDNISFDLKIFGDPDRPIAPTTQQLEPYDAVVTDNDVQYLTNDQNVILNSAGAKVVSINNPNAITQRLSWKIDVLSGNTISNHLISALPRKSTKSDAAPYVLHLLNRKYNQSVDEAQTHNNISVKIPEATFPNTITGAKLHRPNSTPIDLVLNTDNSGLITLNIGTFDAFWGIIELTHSGSLSTNDVNLNTQKIVMYPNPSDEFIMLSGLDGFDNNVSITDIFGKVVMQLPNIKDKSIINTQNLPSGIYIVKITRNNTLIDIKKLVKNQG